jgi:chromosome segregation protein
MFRLQRLEITGFKSFADHTEIVFTGNGITAVVGPNGCGKSNVSDAISWVLGEQRAKSLRGGEMRDVVFAGTKTRKPSGMAEVVLHLVRDDAFEISDEGELTDIDEAISGIDEAAVDMDLIEGIEPEDEEPDAVAIDETSQLDDGSAAVGDELETVKAVAVGSAQVVETRVKSKRHWRPRSFALDFAPGEAVSVTRRLYLSGESEYMLNGKACRLRDITDLFAGTGLSGAHYAVIEQGRIGQILSAKPADRRNLIEEAAGISKFRTRQRAAESRLEGAKLNLNRITDIISEIETRVNSLRRQAAKTRRFKMLQEEFRELLRNLYAAEGRYFTELSATLASDLELAAKAEGELRRQLEAMESSARDATKAARSAEEGLAELRRIHADNALERDRAEREHIYRSEQVVSLNNRCESLRGEITSSDDRLKMLADEIERLRDDEAAEDKVYLGAESELKAAETAYNEASGTLGGIESRIETIRAELMQHTAAGERFDEIGKQLQINLERLRNRGSGLDVEQKRAEENHVGYEKQAVDLAAQLAEEEAKLARLNEEKEALVAATSGSRAELREMEATLEQLSEEHSAKKHRLETLNELEDKRAVYTPQVQRLFAEQTSIGVKLRGVLADRLKVDEKAEQAVEALFGPFLESVIVSSIDDAKRVSTWLRDNGIGRTPLLVIPDSEGESDLTPDAGSIEGLLGIDGHLASALREAFPREMSAMLVDDLANARAVSGAVFVDHDGDMIYGSKLFVGGGRQKESKNESLLAFKRELNGLTSSVKGLAGKLEAARGKVESARSRLMDNESKMVDLQSVLIKVDRGIHGLQIQIRTTREEIERSLRHRKVVESEAGQLVAEIADFEARIADAARDREAAEKARGESLEALTKLNAEISGIREGVNAASIVLNEKRMVAATSGERRRAVGSALRRVESESKEIESRLALQKLELTESDGKLRQLHDSINAITDRINSASDDIAIESQELMAAVEKLNAARTAADAMSSDLAELNKQAAEARDRRASIEIRQAEAVTELKNVTENCQHELNVPLSEVVASIEPAEDFELEAARTAADRLRDQLEGFGAINMLALEELGEAEERHLFLTSQRTDIIDGIAATESALREIKERSRERFRSAFEAINTNFSQFFQELFGGGQGQMTLLEADDILEAGIEVVAQPPGKKLQNIMLLSGGEKAMTAIALVLAIFKYKPSPFCLLDEVDAPLDDANVGRFVNKVAEMSEKTQFIVITHNKRTMEAARALYGVTMQEAGVSKVVSVKFE